MKILILADSLDVGGAESHIYTLAMGLKNQGDCVVVASSGGATAEKLKHNGIKHIKLPDISARKNRQGGNFKNFAHGLNNFFLAKEVISRCVDRELPDVIHAHTRRSAFLTNSICKARKIPLITTAHAKFSMKFPKNALSFWGDATICVSEDIKKHLFAQPRVAKAPVKVIFNGVNLENYNTICDFDAHNIVFVSRLDDDCSLGAYLLCEIAPRLSKIYPDLTIKIIGGGSEYATISKIAAKINNKINRKLIIMVGNAENPSTVFKKNELFVGVSRAALEAMACGLPVILLGNEGYLGLVEDKILPFAVQTNFTCRGFWGRENKKKFHLKEQLLSEIVRYFELSDEKKAKLSEFSQRVVAKYYSAEKMVDLTRRVYEKCVKRKQKLTLCGYYGRGNLGDEMVLSAILRAIDRTRFKVEIINSKNPIKIVKSLVNSDLFVFGGGSLLQNSTSDASLVFYLVLIKVAAALSRRIIMLSNGIGPIENSLVSRSIWLWIIEKTVNNFDFISVRDRNSRLLLQKLLPKRKIELLPDPAMSLFSTEETPNDAKRSKKTHRILFVMCARGLKKHKISQKLLFQELKSVTCELSAKILIVVLNAREDGALGSELAQLLGARVVIPRTIQELKSIFSGAQIAICQRYHGAVFALGCSVPTLVLSDDPKMISLCTEMGLRAAISPENLRENGRLSKCAREVLQHYEKRTNEINTAFLRQSEQAKRLLPRALEN